jgi:hypothetical protein
LPAASGDGFGRSVALSGAVVVGGAPGAERAQGGSGTAVGHSLVR